MAGEFGREQIKLLGREKKVSVERRRFIRVDKYGPIQYKKIGYSVGSRKVVRDISVKGVGFLAEEFIPVSTLLKVKIPWEKSVKPITAIVRVRWVRKLPLQDNYEVGAELEEIDKDSLSCIDNYINRISAQK